MARTVHCIKLEKEAEGLLDEAGVVAPDPVQGKGGGHGELQHPVPDPQGADPFKPGVELHLGDAAADVLQNVLPDGLVRQPSPSVVPVPHFNPGTR